MNKNILFSFLLIFSFLSFYLTEQSWGQSEQNIIIPVGSSVQGCEQNNECFIPSLIEVELGDTVVWLNEDTETHIITSGTTSFGPDGKFQSVAINQGESFSVTFEENMFDPGTYFYYDAEHLWMKGIVIVQMSKTIVEEDDEEIEETIDEEKSVDIEKSTDDLESTPIENEETDLSTSEEDLESVNELEEDVITDDQQSEEGGGCLIATATYGSELSPQVQQLREIRDNFIMKTDTGSKFMSSFNQFYYTFSPTIADWERENPIFKDAVKIIITPLLSSLSILSLLDVDSEAEVVGFGIGIISLNVAIYFAIPLLTFFKIKRRISLKK